MKHPAWWLVAALLAASAWALDPPRPAPAPATSGEAPVEAPAEAPVEASPETAPAAPDAEEPDAAGPQAVEEVPPPAPETRSTGPTPQRFDPSEKVRADFPVSFPIDI